MWFIQLVETCKMFQRTLVRHIKPGDLVVSSDQDRELLVVLCIRLLDKNNSVANITFLNSNNKIIQSSGWIVMYKVTT